MVIRRSTSINPEDMRRFNTFFSRLDEEESMSRALLYPGWDPQKKTKKTCDHCVEGRGERKRGYQGLRGCWLIGATVIILRVHNLAGERLACVKPCLECSTTEIPYLLDKDKKCDGYGARRICTKTSCNTHHESVGRLRKSFCSDNRSMK